MKTTRAIAILALVFGSLAATSAEAGPWHGGGWGHGHGWGWGPRFAVGVDVGLGLGLAAASPYYYPYGYSPYYAAPVVVAQPAPVVIAQPAPPVYMQQGAAPAPAAAPQPSNDWYYCQNPAGYYPYVRSCANGWQRVPAQPTQN